MFTFSPFEDSGILGLYRLVELLAAFWITTPISNFSYQYDLANMYFVDTVASSDLLSHIYYSSTLLDVTIPYYRVTRSLFAQSGLIEDVMPKVQTLSFAGDLHWLKFGLVTNLVMPLLIASFFTVLSYANGFVNVFNRVVVFVYKSMAYQYGGDAGRKYFPFFLYLFIFIASSNILGLMPNVFAITSNLAITFFLSSVSWVGMFLIGVHLHGISFFANFFPGKVPYMLAPLLMFIELVSYVIRILSLSLRLFANIVAGHILLDTTSVFFYYVCATAATSFSLYTLMTSIFLLSLVICLTLFEFLIAIVQAYIFVVLSIIYLNDSLHLHA